MISRKPPPSSPTRLAAGTRTSSKLSSAVSLQRQPILSSGWLTVNPGSPLSITSSEIPW